MNIVQITGTVTVRVDEVDVEQHIIENPEDSKVSYRHASALAALQLPSVRSLTRQLEAANYRLSFKHAERGRRCTIVHFNIISKSVYAG